MRSLLLLPAMLLLASAWGQPLRRPPAAPDPVLSAEFLPPRYHVTDPEVRARVREYLRSRAPDSSESFTFRGNILNLSPELAHRLAEEEGGEEKGKLRRRARLRLERIAGPGILEDEPVFPLEYYPNDFSQLTTPLWGLRNTGSMPGSVPGVDINMPRVWEQFDGHDTLIIAVLDAGFNFNHPDLQGRWFVNSREANGIAGVDDDLNGFVDDVRGWDFVDGDNNPQDYHGHGTMVAGVIAANFDNGIGIAGMLPRVRILPVRVLSTAGYGGTADIVDGVRYAAAMGAHVINFSIGVPGTTQNTAMRNAFIAARDSGVIVSAAAGNDGANLDVATTQPASYRLENVYMIAAHTQNAGLAGFSNYGATTVDLAAPGVDIVTPGIPPALTVFRETFENFTGARWSFPAGTWQVAPDSMEGARSLRWLSGGNATAQVDTIDLRNRNGGLLTFRLHYTRFSTSTSTLSGDFLRVEVQRFGAADWTTLAIINGNVSGQTLTYNLGPVDQNRFRLRFRACIGTACTGTGTGAGRVLRIDDVRVTFADESLPNQGVYTVTGGTSLAAPYFAGYAGLMRLATSRMGLPLTRQRMLVGTVYEPALAGKLITSARLDVAKGLDFYLQTLPRLAISGMGDSTWTRGQSVSFSFAVQNDTAPGPWSFTAVTAPPGSSLSQDGMFTWNTGSASVGPYTLRVKAEKAPHVLRRMVVFSLVAPVPIVAAAPGRESLLRVGSRDFLLPAEAFGRERHAIRIEFYGADGRTLETISGELRIPAGARSAEYRLSGFQGAGLRVWLNGTPLKPSRD